MKDPIERQDAIDALEKIPVREFKKTDGVLDTLVSIGEVYMALKQLPSVQSEIIRCKDCKHLQKLRSEDAAKKFGQVYVCARLLPTCPEDFCSHAERRNES